MNGLNLLHSWRAFASEIGGLAGGSSLEKENVTSGLPARAGRFLLLVLTIR
jgi:hypothetical protein